MTAKLIARYDTRAIDTDGTKIFQGETMPVCAVCGRSHAIVYVVIDDGKETCVGSGCAQTLVGSRFAEQHANVKNMTVAIDYALEDIQAHKDAGVMTLGRFAFQNRLSAKAAAMVIELLTVRQILERDTDGGLVIRR